MGVIGKANGKIRIVLDKLDGEVRILIDNLPFAAVVGCLADYLHDNVGVVAGDLDPEVRVFRNNLNPAVQRNAFASARITIDRLSGGEHRKQCEYKTTY